MARIIQADVRPGLAAVGGAIHTVAADDVVTRLRLAGTCIYDVGGGGCDGQCADGNGARLLERRHPGQPRIRGLPHAAIGAAEIEHVGLIGNAHRHGGPAAPERPYLAPVQLCVQGRQGLSGIRERSHKGARQQPRNQGRNNK
ncbi:MAG: NifU family protein [Gammaproteobacteria bacterium]|nr:NifU family protein [Gammaproteobacteria bacterium]